MDEDEVEHAGEDDRDEVLADGAQQVEDDLDVAEED